MFQSFENTANAQDTPARIAALRARMDKLGVDVFLVPRGDAFRGEYVPASSARLAWLTGFTGSAGLAAIGTRHAALFVDGRYTVQAKGEVAPGLFDVLQVPDAKLTAWLKDQLAEGAVVGFDPWLHSLEEIEDLTKALKPKQIRLKALPTNPVDVLWGQERPTPPARVRWRARRIARSRRRRVRSGWSPGCCG